jgi:hypothetical protein
MKNLRNLWAVALMLTASVFMVACDEEEPIIDVGEGLSVADGIYITQEGVDPVASSQLTTEQVEDEGFAAQAREGFVATYLFLDAGAYNIVETADREIATTYGGTLTDNETYMVADVTAGGAAFSIASSGVYKVTFDALTSEALIFKINTVGIIGDATEGGWGTDTELALEGSASAEGAAWSKSGIILRNGFYKIRFNANWSIDRRVDAAAGYGAENGYVAFTNLGGSVDALVDGNVGANFEMLNENEGEYTFNVSFSNIDQFAASQERTGDAPVITFDPLENQWAVTGAATPNGWADDDAANDPIGVDIDLNYEGVTSGTYTWKLASIALTVDQFKFRANDAWDKNFGPDQATVAGPAASLFGSADGNFTATEAGDYEIVLTTSDDGDSYTVSFTKL